MFISEKCYTCALYIDNNDTGFECNGLENSCHEYYPVWKSDEEKDGDE